METHMVSSWSGNGSGRNDSELCLGSESHPAVLSILLCLVFFLGFLLNFFSLWVFSCRMPCWTSGTILQFNLALSDTIATPVSPLMAVYFAMGNNWPFHRFLCEVKTGLLTTHFSGSTIFLTLISIHRYAAVVHYKNSLMKQKSFVKKLSAGVWGLLLIQAIIYALMLSQSKAGHTSECLSIHHRSLTSLYFLIIFLLLIIGFLLPFLVACFCYLRLAGRLSRLNISTAKGLKVKRKSLRMVGMCLVIFSLCYLPLNVIRTVGVILKKYYPDHCLALLHVETAYYASVVLAGINSCLDPLVYCFGSQNFRDTLRSLRIRPAELPSKSDSEITPNQ